MREAGPQSQKERDTEMGDATPTRWIDEWQRCSSGVARAHQADRKQRRTVAGLTLLCFVAGLLLTIGCSAGAGDAASAGPSDGSAMPASDQAGVLSYNLEQDSLEGTFTLADTVLSFKAAEQGEQLLDVTVDVNGAILTSTLSKAEQAIELDGFVSRSGAETRLREEDRVVLLALDRALQAVPALEHVPMALMLQRSVSLWAQMNDTFSLSRSVTVDENKSYTSLCNYCGQYVQGSHDCDQCSNWEPRCTSSLLLGNRDPGTQYWYPNSNAWSSAQADHVATVYEKGDCFGRCGDTCTSETFGQVLTQDCLNHDQCVRNGHWLVSAYCDDEFADAIDDYFGIPPFVASAPTCGYSTNTDSYFQVCSGSATCTGSPKFGLVCKCNSGTAKCPAGWQGPISAIGITGGATCRKTTVFCP
jgi:hypothetical protein